LWGSILILEETGLPGENNRPLASHGQTLSHNVDRDLNSQHQRG
jgi:hypothetical protein